MRRFLGNALILLGGLIAILGAAEKWLWLLNALTAALGALAVVAGSFIAYRRMIQNRADAQALQDRDAISQIEDPYDLYDEEETPQPEADEKPNKVPLKERAKLMGGALSPLRLLGYLLLVLGFFVLDARGVFEPLPFLAGLLIVPGAALMLLWQNRKS